MAAVNNPLIKEIDTRVEEIKTKIEEAKSNGKKAVDLAVLSPALKVFLDTTPLEQNKPKRSFLGNIFSFITNPLGEIGDRVLQAVAVPTLERAFGGNTEQQRNSIAISDLSVKLAEMQRARAQMADILREKVQISLLEFDDIRRDFQTYQEIARRDSARFQLINIEYRLGQGNTESYLKENNSLDRSKAAVWKHWSMMRSRLTKLKFIVLPPQQE